MDELDNGLSLFEIAENFASNTDDILLAKVSLHINDIDTVIKKFKSFIELKRYLLQTIPTGEISSNENMSLDEGVLSINIERKFDSGFGEKSKNCNLMIFNLKPGLTKRLAYDLWNYFDVKNDIFEDQGDIDDINKCLIESFDNDDETKFIEMLDAGADNLNDVMELAEYENNLKFIKILFKYGADNLNYILIKSLERNHMDIANFMISSGANIFDSFLEACKIGSEESIIYFLRHDIIKNHNYNKGPFSTKTPYIDLGLYVASSNDHVNIIKLFLENGATNINHALLLASEHNSINAVKYFLEIGATDSDSLYYASKNKNVEIVEILLEHGIRDLKGSAINSASQKGNKDIVKLLLQHRYTKYHLNKALLSAINKNNSDVTELLILEGADIFNDALNLAKKRNNKKIIKLLESYI